MARRAWPRMCAMLLGPAFLLYPYAFSQVGTAGSEQAVFSPKSAIARPLVDMRIATPTLTPAPPSEPPAQGGSADLGTALIGLLQVGAGAVLGLGSTLIIGRRDAAARAAGELQAAAMAYHQAFHTYVAAWTNGGGNALGLELDRSFNTLRAELLVCERRHPRWKKARVLHDQIGVLNNALKQELWEGDRQEIARTYIARLEEVHKPVLDLVMATEHPLRKSRPVRRA